MGRQRTRWKDYIELDGTGWGINQAKCWKWWQTVLCGDSILSCCTRNPHGHERALKEEEGEDEYAKTSLVKRQKSVSLLFWPLY